MISREVQAGEHDACQGNGRCSVFCVSWEKGREWEDNECNMWSLNMMAKKWSKQDEYFLSFRFFFFSFPFLALLSMGMCLL